MKGQMGKPKQAWKVQYIRGDNVTALRSLRGLLVPRDLAEATESESKIRAFG